MRYLQFKLSIYAVGNFFYDLILSFYREFAGDLPPFLINIFNLLIKSKNDKAVLNLSLTALIFITLFNHTWLSNQIYFLKTTNLIYLFADRKLQKLL